jgi:2-keto-3-deoxy-galactonokinase
MGGSPHQVAHQGQAGLVAVDLPREPEVQDHGIAILPGLTCRGRTGAPDVMRGEETQILGALRLHPNLARGRHIFCLPGTHAKWVAVSDGAVTQFQTALSGELFELLRRHSVLARDGGEADAQDRPSCWGWIRAAEDRLLHCCSASEAAWSRGNGRGDAASYLSGLVLGKDIATAMALFPFDGPVQLICTPALAALYGKALSAYDVKSAVIDGDRAALAGLITPMRKFSRALIHCWPNSLWSPSCAASPLPGLRASPCPVRCGVPRHRSAAQFARTVQEHRVAGKHFGERCLRARARC